MGVSYAQERVSKPHLAFRLRSRALIAARSYLAHAPHANPPCILDMGAAEGRTMVELHRLLNARESVGIEFAADLVEAAGELPRACTVHQGDVTKPHPLVPPESFDLVTALAVLEHLDDLDAMGRQVVRALRPGGVFVATCPSPRWDKVSGSLKLHKDEHHTCAFDRAKFSGFARRAGLEPLTYRRFMFAPVGFLPYVGLKVSAPLAARLDSILRPVPLMGLLMVNQVFVARRPAGVASGSAS